MDVRIELIDEADGTVIADSEVALDSLPEQFADAEATLTVGDTAYRVVRAEPSTRATIAALGSARLTLRAITAPPAPSGRFAHATVEGARPATVAVPAGQEVTIRIPADAYRQTELVAAAAGDAVDAELADVAAALAAGRSPEGFAACHTRRRVARPLEGARVSLATLVATIGVEARPYGFRGEVGMVDGGFALPSGDALVYGVAREGRVEVLAVHGILEDIIGQLHALAFEHGLMVVEWRTPRRLRAVEEGFAE